MSSNIRINRICQQCGSEFEAKTTVTQFCSDRCAKHNYKARKRVEKVKASHDHTKVVRQRSLVGILRRVTMSFRGKRSMYLAGGRVQQMLFQRFKVSY